MNKIYARIYCIHTHTHTLTSRMKDENKTVGSMRHHCIRKLNDSCRMSCGSICSLLPSSLWIFYINAKQLTPVIYLHLYTRRKRNRFWALVCCVKLCTSSNQNCVKVNARDTERYILKYSSILYWKNVWFSIDGKFGAIYIIKYNVHWQVIIKIYASHIVNASFACLMPDEQYHFHAVT